MNISDEQVERALRLIDLAIKAREARLLDRADELTSLASESYKQAGIREMPAFSEAE